MIGSVLIGLKDRGLLIRVLLFIIGGLHIRIKSCKCLITITDITKTGATCMKLKEMYSYATLDPKAVTPLYTPRQIRHLAPHNLISPPPLPRDNSYRGDEEKKLRNNSRPRNICTHAHGPGGFWFWRIYYLVSW